MKKMFKRIASVALAASFVLGGSACAGQFRTSDLSSEKVDTSKTQLYVYSYDGGYGSKWLDPIKEEFEALHAEDTNWETGKKGVQVIITAEKTGGDNIPKQTKLRKEEVYFNENVSYTELKLDGNFADITEAVTSDLSAFGDPENTTIESKLTEAQKSFLGEDGHYYAVPHYFGYFGLTYDMDFFDAYNLWFAKTPTSNSKFVSRTNPTKSAGIDGIEGTYDDGLPTTYDEFFELCDKIANDAQSIPIIWAGAQYIYYLNSFMSALVTDADMIDQAWINYKGTGTATSLGTVNANGEFVKDADPTEIKSSNFSEMARTSGRYYALEFMHKIITMSEYHNADAFNLSLSYTDAQDRFLMDGNMGPGKNNAMLADGIWWINEASDTIDYMGSQNSKFARENRHFGLMPLPKPNTEILEKYRALQKEGTLIDNNYALCFMKPNMDEWKKPLALDFIKYVCSDKALKSFTQITNTPKSLKYSMTEEEMEGMSSYGKSIMNLFQNSDILYPYTGERHYINNSAKFRYQTMWPCITEDNTNYSFPSEAFHEGGKNSEGLSVKEYFDGMKKAWAKESWT